MWTGAVVSNPRGQYRMLVATKIDAKPGDGYIMTRRDSIETAHTRFCRMLTIMG